MITLRVNGAEHSLDVDPEMPLLWALRDVLGLTGTKYGCGEALCGACTVHLDGRGGARLRDAGVAAPRASAMTTIEGLSPNGDHPLQQAWVELARAAVRLLPGRADHERGGAAGREPEAQRRRHRPVAVRQPLPLRHVHAHPRGRSQAAGRRRERRSERRSSHRPAHVPRGRARAGAVGGLVLGRAPRRPRRAEEAASPKPESASVFVHVGARRDRDHRLPPLRDGPGHPQLAARAARRRARRGHGARARRAGGRDVRYGDQNTDGSSSVRHIYEADARAPAPARARCWWPPPPQRWGVPAARLRRARPPGPRPGDGTHAGVRRAGRRGRAAARAQPARASSCGRTPSCSASAAALPLLDGPAYVTGSALFGADVRLPGMLTAVIARPPVVGGTVAKVRRRRGAGDPGRAARRRACRRRRARRCSSRWGGVAVVADNTWAALRGRAALDIDVGRRRERGVRLGDLPRGAVRRGRRRRARVSRNVGDVERALAKAARVIEAEYHVPHLAHVADGAAGRASPGSTDGALRGLGADAEPAGARRTEVARALGVDEDAGHGPRDVPGRRLRPQVEGGLRRRRRRCSRARWARRCACSGRARTTSGTTTTTRSARSA